MVENPFTLYGTHGAVAFGILSGVLSIVGLRRTAVST
jgi:hypothetical protein